jgi:hypothetical protein
VRGFTNSPLFEIGRVLVRLDHVPRCLLDTNHSVSERAPKLCVASRNFIVNRAGGTKVIGQIVVP